MNVVWYLYGGSDFQKSSTPSPVCSSGDHSTSPSMKHKEFHPRQDLPLTSSPTSQSKGSPHSTRSHLNSSGSRYKQTSNTSESTHYKKTHKGRMLNWKIAGGPDRNHDVVMEIHINKVCISSDVTINYSIVCNNSNICREYYMYVGLETLGNFCIMCICMII